MQELAADAVVEAHAAGDVLDIGADRLAQIRHLVDEGDLGRQERVGGVFDDLGAAPVGEQERRAVEIERPVDQLHHLPGALVVGADDDAVGPAEILDRRALAQEFGIGDDGKFLAGRGLAHDALDRVAGADRHRRLGDDHLVAVEMPGDLAGAFMDDG